MIIFFCSFSITASSLSLNSTLYLDFQNCIIFCLFLNCTWIKNTAWFLYLSFVQCDIYETLSFFPCNSSSPCIKKKNRFTVIQLTYNQLQIMCTMSFVICLHLWNDCYIKTMNMYTVPKIFLFPFAIHNALLFP